jgi:hypothetical protein
METSMVEVSVSRVCALARTLTVSVTAPTASVMFSAVCAPTATTTPWLTVVLKPGAVTERS